MVRYHGCHCIFPNLRRGQLVGFERVRVNGQRDIRVRMAETLGSRWYRYATAQHVRRSSNDRFGIEAAANERLTRESPNSARAASVRKFIEAVGCVT
jgi:hypothetical protein